jgi:hypothetical protein
MRVQQPVRDRNTSIWQSAVRQTLVGRGDLSDSDKELAEYGVSLHAKSVERNEALPDPIPVPGGALNPKTGSPINIAHASKAAFDSLQAHQNTPTKAAGLFSALHDFVMEYSSWDIAGWAQCGWYYTKYYVLAHLPPSYNDWQAHAPADINFGVIDYRLPKNSRVLMIGDWGTHMPDNVALLRQALKKFEPDVIIHLGDVYYSGTVEECTKNVLEVLDQVVPEAGLANKRPAFFSIPGNHDYYSGGSGFYRMIGKVNSGVAGCTQQASYFCLRTEDDTWQFLGMDTGYGDRNPVEQQAPVLQVHESAWHVDKLETFPGTTILLSHHQLISAKESLNAGLRPYLNEYLYATFKQYFDRIAAWYWGHEHNFILFDDDFRIQPGDPPLKKGRLVGCSAYEEDETGDPYDINHPEARFLANMPHLHISNYKTDLQKFYNHAFAILDVTPDKMTATYYEYPSWGTASGPPSEPTIDKYMYQEHLVPMRVNGKPVA